MPAWLPDCLTACLLASFATACMCGCAGVCVCVCVYVSTVAYSFSPCSLSFWCRTSLCDNSKPKLEASRASTRSVRNSKLKQKIHWQKSLNFCIWLALTNTLLPLPFYLLCVLSCSLSSTPFLSLSSSLLCSSQARFKVLRNALEVNLNLQSETYAAHTHASTHVHIHIHTYICSYTLMVMKIVSLCYYYRKAWQIYIVICVFCFILICPLGLISILLLFPFVDMFIYLLMHLYRCFSLAERLMPAIWAA